MIKTLETLRYKALGDRGVPERFALEAPQSSAIPQNLCICIEGCFSLKYHLLVRDLCRQGPEVRDLYGPTEVELYRREWTNADAYCEAKSEILAFILAKAGLDEAEHAQVWAVNTKTTSGMEEC